MHEDVKWFFGLIIIFGIFWFVSGGLNKPTSKQPFITPSGETYGTDPIHIGQNSYYNETGYSSSAQPQKTLTAREEVSQGLIDAGVKAEQIKKELAKLDEANRASPLTKKLSIQGVTASGSAANEYITIRATDTNMEKVLISGLRLQSSVSGLGTQIPKGAYLPFQNQINIEEPVFLAPGETAYIITGRSPLGMSFRPNMCTGFFNQYQQFNPGLPSRCPAPGSENLPPPMNQYNDACLDYINSLPSCTVITSVPPSISPECQRFVTNEINYTKCVDHHKNDKNFYDSSWRIYLKRDDPLWKNRRELIQLLDQNGKVIDAITY